MEYFGHMKGGIVVLEGDAKLPDGTRVRISPVPSAPRRQRTPTFARASGLLAAGTPPPTDQEVKQILEEERTRKYR